MNRLLTGIVGMAVIFAIAVLLSSNRRAIRLRVVGAAFALQVTIAVIVLYVPPGRAALAGLAGAVSSLLSYSRVGTSFLFGKLAEDPLGQNFALQALPTIIFFAALISILYYLGIMPLVVRWIGGALQRIIGVSKVESLCAAANIFVGQSESPLVIRPYLAALTPPQLFAVMTSGMAGVAGTILAAYAAMGIRIDYLIAASFMAAPGGLVMAKIMMPDDPARITPEPEEPPIAIAAGIDEAERPANIIMAASQGARTGVKLAVAVGAMVLAFVALVALANGLLSGLGGWFGVEGLTFQRLVGMVFAPVMYLINVPAHEIGVAGGLFGEKLVLNEFVAFISLGKAQAGLSASTVAIVTFALCGFANFSSIAIQMAVTGSLAPNQRPMIAKLGIKALIAASLSNLMSAALAGLLLTS